ncbi:hypothetical protein FB451DRAFT_1401639 [Mycena latifolia]|nr:hypothetical protein FB451DRAFT_1401639 [Mycena latifolia]
MDDDEMLASVTAGELLQLRASQFLPTFITANPGLFLNLDWVHPEPSVYIGPEPRAKTEDFDAQITDLTSPPRPSRSLTVGTRPFIDNHPDIIEIPSEDEVAGEESLQPSGASSKPAFVLDLCDAKFDFVDDGGELLRADTLILNKVACSLHSIPKLHPKLINGAFRKGSFIACREWTPTWRTHQSDSIPDDVNETLLAQLIGNLACLCTDADFQQKARTCLAAECQASEVGAALGLQAQQCGALSLSTTTTPTATAPFLPSNSAADMSVSPTASAGDGQDRQRARSATYSWRAHITLDGALQSVPTMILVRHWIRGHFPRF